MREVIAANSTETWVALLGWAMIAVGMGVLVWGFTINGRQWWKSAESGRPERQSAFIKGKAKSVELDSNYSGADNFVDADTEELVAKRNLHDPIARGLAMIEASQESE